MYLQRPIREHCAAEGVLQLLAVLVRRLGRVLGVRGNRVPGRPKTDINLG